MQDVASYLCDDVIQLRDDLRIEGSTRQLDLHLGRSLEGRLFSELLCEQDGERLTKIIKLANSSRIPQCISVALQATASLVAVNLLVVAAGHASVRYLVGVRYERESAFVSVLAGGITVDSQSFGKPEPVDASAVHQSPS